MATLKEIAQKAKVSQATVSRVLSGHPVVKPETRQNVLYWAKKLNYQPNAAARSLAGSSTNLLGIIFPEIANPFFSEILDALEEAANFEGYQILLNCTHKSIDREKNILNELKRHNVDGIITIPVSSDDSAQYYKALNLPVVVITKQMEGFNSISVSHYQGGQKIAQHLHSLGYQKVGYVGPVNQSTSSIKFQGFRDFIAEHDMELSDVIETPVPATIDSLVMYQTTKEYLNSYSLRSQALFANDDVTACDVIRALSEKGYSVPGDVAVIGFDNSLLAKKMYPSVSSLSQPLHEIGQQAVHLMLRILNGEQTEVSSYLLDTRVISRDSTVSTITA